MSCGQPHMIPLPPWATSRRPAALRTNWRWRSIWDRWSPGEPLREVEIAEANGVSRTIVRAALQRLEAQGLVEIVRNKGARVRAGEAASVDDMIELHVELTALAARHAARRASAAELSRIGQFVDMLEHVSEDVGRPEEFQHLRIGFVRALFAAAGPVLAERLRCAAPVVPHHARAMDDVRTEAGQVEAARLAREVLTALQARSTDAAEKAAEQLVRRHAERTLAKPAKTPARAKARSAA